MLKVIQFIHGLNMGGAETLVKDYVLGFDKENIDITVLCYEHCSSPYEQILREAGIRVIYICDEIPECEKRDFLSKVRKTVKLYWKIRRHIREICPDIIHIHLMLSRYVKFARPAKSTAILYTQHFQVERWKKNYPQDLKAAKWLKKHYTMRLIALNENMRKELNYLFHVDDTLIFNNGVYMSRFENTRSRADIRRELGIAENAFVIGHVGRFSQIKNHDFLVDVFGEISKVREAAFLLMIGKGETKEQIEERLNTLGLGEGKSMTLSDRTDVPDLLKSMDFLIFPSFSEGMPVILVEAQVAGVRCLVSDVVSRAIEISNLIQYESLKETPARWGEKILDWKTETAVYYNVEKWDMKNIIRELEQAYMKLSREAAGGVYL